MKTLNSLTTIVICSALFSGCSFVPPKDINSTFFSPPPGSTLTLKRSITIPANDTRVRIQEGKIQPSYSALDSYYPNCEFELYSISEQQRVVEPDTFTITKVIRNEEVVSLPHLNKVAGISFGGGPPLYDYQTIMEIRSNNQPDVVKLTCAQWEDSNDGQHITIRQIRKTLGQFFELSLTKN